MIKTIYELRKRIQGIDSIIVYGAGYVGALILSYLQQENIKISNVIVTKKSDARICKDMQGYSIETLEEVQTKRESPVFVAVSEKYNSQIVKHLYENGFYNIISISDSCVSQIELFSDKLLYFQTHIVDHCNLKCRGCYHFSSLAEEKFLSLDEFEKDVSRLSSLFDKRMKEIMLLGGEPLLHPEAKDFFAVARKYFPNGKLKMLTNGLLLLNIEPSFFSTMKKTDAELWVTKYPVNFDYRAAEKRALNYGIEIHYFNEEPVRTLGHQPLDLSGGKDYVQNFRKCYRANQCIDLKHGKLYPCIIPAEIEPFCKFFQVNIPVLEDDGVDIYSVSDVDDLLERLNRPMPFCRFCNREAIEVFGAQPWERTKYEIEEWTV
ncbi:MAG: radical SAM protein [Selenomonadaceae bacterium]|nr:radical SAM protein [Selenomonadaceae bacterium]